MTLIDLNTGALGQKKKEGILIEHYERFSR